MRNLKFLFAHVVVQFILVMLVFSNSMASSPNVVMIISDDQSFGDFGFMGNRLVHTPNLDALASQSARFTHGYVPSSVCRPSLATLLTGLYPHQHGVHFNHPPPGFAKLTKSASINKQQYDDLRARGAAFISQHTTLPGLLAENGYRCLQTGKFWEGHYRNAGFTDGMTTGQPSGGKHGDKQLANGDVAAHGNGDHGLTIGRETMKPIEDFIADCGQTPFLIWYAPFLPHTPHDAPAEFVKLANHPQIAPYQRPYYASIAQFDATVGQLLDVVNQHGDADNTIFVFVVDNGWQPDANRPVKDRQEWNHTKNSKRAPFDAGLRTPILFRWDGHVEPKTYSAPVSSIDIFPTLLTALAIATDRPQLPGVDLWPVLAGNESPSADRAVFGAVYPGDASVLGDPSADVAYRWIRKGDHKLIVPENQRGKPAWNDYLVQPALYDVVRDPGESIDLASDRAMAPTIAKLSRELDRWWSPNKPNQQE